MRKDQIRFLSLVMAAGIILEWAFIMEALNSYRVSIDFSENIKFRESVVPTRDAFYVWAYYAGIRVFVGTWQSSLLICAALVICLALVARVSTMGFLALLSVATYAGLLTLGTFSHLLVSASDPNLVSADSLSAMYKSMGQTLAYGSLKWEGDFLEGLISTIEWLFPVIFIRVPLFIALVVVPLIAMHEAFRYRLLRFKAA